ncbi:kinase-like domain-containing protein, partial [Suillus lakei]
MSSGTLYEYLEKQGTISTSTRVKLAKGVADGLKYLHSNKVVHGDLYPVCPVVSGHPRLTDFGLATVAGDCRNRNFAPRWRAPEVLGIGHAGDIVVRPDFKSDVYSFGSVMFFGVKPWEGYHANRITVALSRQETPTHRDNIGNDHWNLINRC